jgi:hypothetical protein
MLEEVQALQSDELGVRRRAEDMFEDARGGAADENLGIVRLVNADAADAESFEIRRKNRSHGIGHDNVRQRERPRRGARAGGPRVLGVDAVVERDKLEADVVPERNRIDAQRSLPGLCVERRRRRRSRSGWERTRRRGRVADGWTIALSAGARCRGKRAGHAETQCENLPAIDAIAHEMPQLQSERLVAAPQSHHDVTRPLRSQRQTRITLSIHD